MAESGKPSDSFCSRDNAQGPTVFNAAELGMETAVQRTVEALRAGRIAVIPTDTVYGLAADARNPEAVRSLYDIKGRDKGKPIPLLAGGLSDVLAYGARLDAGLLALAERFWPGPLTLVLEVNRERGAQGGDNEGFRVPDCALTLELLRRVGGVLRVTSANLSGEPPALDAAEALRALDGFHGVVLDGGPVSGGVPSTVARMNAGRLCVLRAGALSAETLEAALGLFGKVSGCDQA